MYGKKAWLGNIWGASGLATASLGVVTQRRLTILAYHRIIDVPDENRYSGDAELISAGVKDFDMQMRFVKDHFEPLSFLDVIDAMARDKPLPKNSLIVTFDDGHHDNYTNAFPVLKASGVPATIFLSTENVDKQIPFWFDRVAQLLFFASSGTHSIGQIDVTLSDVASRRTASRRILKELKQVPNATRLSMLEEMERRFASRLPMKVAAQQSAVTWQEVDEMSRAGIEFGSHTVTHPILTKLDDDGIREELETSRAVIRLHTGQPVETIAYPVGKTDAYDRRVLAAASTCGYRLGVSYETGINPSHGFEPFALRRLAVERYVSFSHFKSMLSIPALFG